MILKKYRIRSGKVAKLIVKIADKLNTKIEIVGIAIWPFIFISPPEYLKNETLIRHEEKHIEQWVRYLIFGFLPLYLFYHIKYGYKKNPLEIEARKAGNKK